MQYSLRASPCYRQLLDTVSDAWCTTCFLTMRKINLHCKCNPAMNCTQIFTKTSLTMNKVGLLTGQSSWQHKAAGHNGMRTDHRYISYLIICVMEGQEKIRTSKRLQYTRQRAIWTICSPQSITNLVHRTICYCSTNHSWKTTKVPHALHEYGCWTSSGFPVIGPSLYLQRFWIIVSAGIF